MVQVAPLLVFAWGNASRGDDALGPRFAEALRVAWTDGRVVEVLDDHQLQIEHALDLQGRERVLFVDASLKAAAPFEVTPVRPQRDASYSSHAMSPQALLQVHQDAFGTPPPPSWLLAIRGEAFELGQPPGHAALQNLQAALSWVQGWMVERAEA